MSNKNFLNIGKSISRNIINSYQVDETVDDIIAQKDLINYPNVQIWVKTVLKNYILQKEDVVTINDTSLLSKNIQDLINSKNIQAPYHEVHVTSKTIDKVNHTIDYLKAAFPVTKDLSRISVDQALINADVWLANRLKNLSEEEDVDNVHTLLEFSHEGKDYRWVNICSHKALQRESKLMNHCIETYWYYDYHQKTLKNQESDFYSLRDSNNIPLVSLYARDMDDKKSIDNIKEVQEVKEKNNALLTHEKRELVDYLMDLKKFTWHRQECYNSHYYPLANESFQYTSINRIINKKLRYRASSYLDMNDFLDYFPKNKLLGINHWKKIVLNQKEIQSDKLLERNFFSGYEIHAQQYENAILTFDCVNLIAQDIKNTNMILYNVNKKTNTTRFFHNVSDAIIMLLEDEPGEAVYIFKNCKNISFEIKKVNINDAIKNPINIVQVDCENIDIKLIRTKNILSVDSNNQITYMCNNHYENITTMNKSKNINLAMLLNSCQKCHLNLLDQQSLQYKFGKQLDIKIANNETGKQLIFNSYLTMGSLQENIVELLKNPIEKIDEVFNLFNTDAYQDYNTFLSQNAYQIVQSPCLEQLPEAHLLINYQIREIKATLLENRQELINVLTGTDDNFSNYFFNVLEKPNPECDMNTELTFYMLKNEIVEQVLIHANDSVLYRFSIAEKKIRNFIGKRWANFFLDAKDVEHLDSKNVTDILVQPYDNNLMLNNVKDDMFLSFDDVDFANPKYTMKI